MYRYIRHIKNIEELDVLSYFTILSMASEFGEDVLAPARVLVEKLERWYKGIMKEWNQHYVDQTFQDIIELIKKVKDKDNILQKLDKIKDGEHEEILHLLAVLRELDEIREGKNKESSSLQANIRELDEIREGKSKESFPLQTVLKKICAYQDDIKHRKVEKIEKKLKHLRDDEGNEVYVDRMFKNMKTDTETSDLENLVLSEKTTLLQAVAGGGKSSLCVKLVQEWVAGEKLQDITMCLFIASGSSKKIPLTHIIWDEYEKVPSWKDQRETYQDLILLAKSGRLAIIIDGLDEFGEFSRKDVDNAARIASDPNEKIDIKTTCLGLLSKKILPGAKILATGRNTEYINSDLLDNNADTFQIVDLSTDDRTMLVRMLEKNYQRRKKIINDLEKISTMASEHFLRTPFMTRNVIKLIKMKNVNTEDLKSQTDLYLMILLCNLDFHSDKNKAFTELEPPEDHDYLANCLKVGQNQIQEESQKVKGCKKNVRLPNGGTVQYFETRALGEKIRIPMEFLLKLGIFDIGANSLNIIHLSYMEFLASGSLLRQDVNIRGELDKIKSFDRYVAVVMYMAGFFNDNSNIEFLNDCKNLKDNFLHLLEHETHRETVQSIFRSILESRFNKTEIKLTTHDQELSMSEDMITLLNEVQVVTSDKIDNFELSRIEIEIKLQRTNGVLAALANIVSNYNSCLNEFVTNNTVAETEEDVEYMKYILHHCETWDIKEVKLSDGLENLPALLSKASQWIIKYLELSQLSGADWEILATLVKTGHVETLEIRGRVGVADRGKYFIEVAGHVDTLQMRCKIEEEVDSVVRLLRYCPGVKVDTLYLTHGNHCRNISVNRGSLHIGMFNIDHTDLLPSWLSDYPGCTIDTVSVRARLSTAAWQQLACLLSHCRLKELRVARTDYLVTTTREDIETLWRCVQARWLVGRVEIKYKRQLFTLAGIDSVNCNCCNII